jgi:hypothetical protein
MVYSHGPPEPHHGWRDGNFHGTQLGCHGRDLFPYCEQSSSHHTQFQRRKFANDVGAFSTAALTLTRFLSVVVFVVTLTLPSIAHAATYYFVGTSGGNTSNPNSWTTTDPTSCTGGGAGTPTTGDLVVFDADCDNNATINQSLSVDGVVIESGYAGAITQNQTVTVGSSGFSLAGGTWTGNTNNMTVNGYFSVTGGTFTAPTTTLSVTGNFSRTGGTFSSNSGTVALTGGNQSISGSISFATLT